MALSSIVVMKLYPSCRERILVKPAEKGPGAMYLTGHNNSTNLKKSNN